MTFPVTPAEGLSPCQPLRWKRGFGVQPRDWQIACGNCGNSRRILCPRNCPQFHCLTSGGRLRMTIVDTPLPATSVSATSVFRRPKSPALIALIAPTLRKRSVLGRELAPHQRRGEVAPGEGHFLDIDAGHGVDPLAHPLAAQPL